MSIFIKGTPNHLEIERPEILAQVKSQVKTKDGIRRCCCRRCLTGGGTPLLGHNETLRHGEVEEGLRQGGLVQNSPLDHCGYRVL